MSLKREADDFESFLCPEERYLIFQNLYPLIKKERNDEFFGKSVPSSETERLSYIHYWNMIPIKEQCKRVKIESEFMEAEAETYAEKAKFMEAEAETYAEKAKFMEAEAEKEKNDEIIRRLEDDKKKNKEKAEKEILEKKRLEMLKALLGEEFCLNNYDSKIFQLLNGLKYENYSILEGKLSLLDQTDQNKIVQHVYDLFSESSDRQFILLKLKISCRFEKNDLQLFNANGQSIAPSKMSGIENVNAANTGNDNFIFGYPIDINLFFPIVFCHQMFGDFIDIINENHDNKILKEYFDFLDNDLNIKKLDECCLSLFKTILSDPRKGKESFNSREITKAFKELFGQEYIKERFAVKNYWMDAMISFSNFPLAIFEFRDRNYTIDAVYQALQYYASIKAFYVDNFPSFMITIDRGLLFVYGVAILNSRVFCDHLMTVELTAARSEINNSATKFRRTIGALYFFHNKMMNRLGSFSQDDHVISDKMNEKYNEINLLMISKSSRMFPVYFPSIFDVLSPNTLCVESTEISSSFNYTTEGTRIPIEFEKRILKNVFIVSTNHFGSPTKLVLKLTADYCIETHFYLASRNLAPKIFGYEKLYGNYHAILMEYMDPSQWQMLNNYSSQFHSSTLSKEKVMESLEIIMSDFHKAGFVHGDFRSCNVLMKVNLDLGSEDEHQFEFKFIDFDASGRIDTRYPDLVFKNQEISWPVNNFGSDSKRNIEHDLYMFRVLNDLI